MYKVTEITRTYLASETINNNNFGGWLAVNVGTADVAVNGYTLAPGEGLDFTHLHPEVVWGSPITLTIANPGGQIRLTQLRYTHA